MSVPPPHGQGWAPAAGGRRQARRIILAQIGVTVSIAAVFAACSGWGSGSAALFGGMINVVANVYFARRLYRRRVQSASATVLGFYVGEVVKLFITMALLALAIGVFKLSVLPLFTAFGATLLVFWLALAPGVDRWLGDRA